MADTDNRLNVFMRSTGGVSLLCCVVGIPGKNDLC